MKGTKKDNLNPNHYKSHPSGIECIQITEHMDFLSGNAMKYLWRAGLKDDKIQDLKKAAWYIQRLIDKEAEDGDSIRHRDYGDTKDRDKGHTEDSLHCRLGYKDVEGILCRLTDRVCPHLNHPAGCLYFDRT